MHVTIVVTSPVHTCTMETKVDVGDLHTVFFRVQCTQPSTSLLLIIICALYMYMCNGVHDDVDTSIYIVVVQCTMHAAVDLATIAYYIHVQ